MTNHSINEYEGLPGVTTFLIGRKLNRLELRAYLGKGRFKGFFGAFATNDGIVAYSQCGQARAFEIKAGR